MLPALDRGFIFGDGVYEVIPVYDGAPLRMAASTSSACSARWTRSASRTRTPRDEWMRAGGPAARPPPGQPVGLHPGHARRAAKRDHVDAGGRDAHGLHDVQSARHPLEGAGGERRGAASPPVDFRWEKCHIKSISLLGNVLARQISADAGAVETIMFRDGMLTEASASNVFVVKGGTVLAPPQRQPDPAGHHLRPAGEARRRRHGQARDPPDHRGRAARRRRECGSRRRPRKCSR